MDTDSKIFTLLTYSLSSAYEMLNSNSPEPAFIRLVEKYLSPIAIATNCWPMHSTILKVTITEIDHRDGSIKSVNRYEPNEVSTFWGSVEGFLTKFNSGKM